LQQQQQQQHKEQPNMVNVTSVVRNPLTEDGQIVDVQMPRFRVIGDIDGQAFEADISVEFDGRDVDIEPISGFNVQEAYDDHADLMDAIYENPAYEQAFQEYQASLP